MKTVLTFCIILTAHLLAAQVEPLRNAHSHNDYRQKHPLSDALDKGFISIEADVFLIKGELIVSHTHPFFKKQTLEELYLEPLEKICKTRNEIYKNEPLILLVDIKSNAAETYMALKKVLEAYSSILTKSENGKLMLNAVTIVLTGNKPYEALQKESSRYAFIDQNLLGVAFLAELCPLASTKYSNVWNWKGKGELTKVERERLTALVNLAHLQGKKVRLWASPENEKVWTELLNCGVDLISTDELQELSAFLKGRKKTIVPR